MPAAVVFMPFAGITSYFCLRQHIFKKKIPYRCPGYALNFTIINPHRYRFRAAAKTKYRANLDLISKPVFFAQLLQGIDHIVGTFDVAGAAYANMDFHHTTHSLAR